MKLLFFTDTHIRGTSPINRTDDFPAALENKLKEVVEIANTNQVDFVIHGGDLFDRPDINISVASKFIPILQNIQAPIYIVSGNHDIYGHNQATLYRSMLGLLIELGLLKNLSQEPSFIKKDGITVQLTGGAFSFSIDTDENRTLYRPPYKDSMADYAIHTVHGFLTDTKLANFIPHTPISMIEDTVADITLSGHYHAGFATKKLNNKFFCNPGSLVRISNHDSEMNRMPKVLIIDLTDEIKISDVYLKCAKRSDVVLDTSVMLEKRLQEERLVDFKNTVSEAIDFKKVNLLKLLEEVSRIKKIEEPVVKEALHRLGNVYGDDPS